MKDKQKEDSLTLELLEAIEERSEVTQRHLARHMGVALGLANSYLKRCVRKGLVKIHQAPANRYLYYLTPKGFAEKGRLTADYLSFSFQFYRRAGESCAQAFSSCRREHWRRVVLCGASELAEIASLRAQEFGIEVVAIYDPDSAEKHFLGYPVVSAIDQCPPSDAWIVTDLRNSQATYERLLDELPAERVLIPAILGVKAAA